MNRKANIKQQKRGVYPGHQCFNADDDRTYYSRKKVNGHSEGNKWIKNVLKKYNYTIKVVGKPFVQNRPPVGGVPE
ncbi:hypothetical protein [Hyella patelloides]|nr:hypothetical protein [Hyella patelloides]